MGLEALLEECGGGRQSLLQKQTLNQDVKFSVVPGRAEDANWFGFNFTEGDLRCGDAVGGFL